MKNYLQKQSGLQGHPAFVPLPVLVPDVELVPVEVSGVLAVQVEDVVDIRPDRVLDLAVVFEAESLVFKLLR